MVVGQMVNVLTGQSGYILSMGGHSKYVLANALFVIALTLALMTLLVPSLGIIGAASAFAGSTITINLLRIWQIKRLENIAWITFPQVLKLIGWLVFAAGLFYFLRYFILNPFSLGLGFMVYFTLFSSFHYFLTHYTVRRLSNPG